jgi:parvulin-like peptidyl-prolyl isomerase
MKTLFLRSKTYLTLVLALVAAGCGSVPRYTSEHLTKPDFPVAVIDSSKNIMASDLYRRLAQSDLIEQGGILDSSIYWDTLNAIIVDSIVSTEARGADLRRDKNLYDIYKKRYNDFILDYIYRRHILDSVSADSAAVDSFYKANPERFTFQEQVRVRQLTISAVGLKRGQDSLSYKNYSMEQLDTVAERIIFNLRARIDSGASLGELAYLYSVHRESGNKYGDLNYFFRNTYNKQFEEMAFSLPIGTVSQPFKTPDGWHIIEIIDHIDSGLAPLDGKLYEDARRQCLMAKAGERSRRFADSATAAAKIIYNDSALEMFIHQVPDTTWAAIVGDVDTITFYRLRDYFDYYQTEHGLNGLTLEDKRKALLKNAQRYAIIQAGERLGYGEETPAREERERLYHKYAMDLIRKDRIDLYYNPPDSLIEDYYRKNINKYRYKKPIYVQHIIVQDSAFGEYLRDQAISGIDFMTLAKEYYPGEEAIRTAAADLGYIGPEDMPEAFYRTAMGTAKGDVSHPVKTEWGYHIIKVVEKLYDVSLAEARGEIANILKYERQKKQAEEWDRNIMSRHRIEYKLDKIGKIELPPKSRR